MCRRKGVKVGEGRKKRRRRRSWEKMRKTEQVFWGRCELLESRAVMGITERGDAAERNSLGETGSFYWLDRHF